MARRLTRTVVCAGCGRLLRIVLGGQASEDCPGCRLDYDPGTGQVLPVCEGLPPLCSAEILPPRPPERALYGKRADRTPLAIPGRSREQLQHEFAAFV